MHKKCQLEKVCSHFIYYVSQPQVHSVNVKTWLLDGIVQHIILLEKCKNTAEEVDCTIQKIWWVGRPIC